MKVTSYLLAAGLSFTVVATSSFAVAQEPTREITNIAGDLYRFQNNFHFSVFLVTEDGIITTDPINAEAAEWLKAELQQRFDQPVKYVIYSHHHGDHASGGEVFADTATFIGHEKIPAALEADGITTVRAPDIVYSDRMDVTLGGKTVELHYVGKSHSDNQTVMRFPDEEAIFAVDFIRVKQLPFSTLASEVLPDWIDAMKQVEALEFDIVADGHSVLLGTPQDVADHRKYVEELTAAVQVQIDAGATVEEAKAAIQLDEYKDWSQYDAWLPENVEGVYRILTSGS